MEAGEHLADHLLDAEFLDLAVLHIGGVLGGDDDVRDADWFVLFVNDGDLRLGVGAEPRARAALANAGEFTPKTVCEHDRRRHELRGLVASKTKHQALIARPLFQACPLPSAFRLIDALRNVRRLIGNDVGDENLVGVKDIVRRARSRSLPIVERTI